MTDKEKNLIICNPYEMPTQHYKYDRARRAFELVSGRRSAGFLMASEESKSFDDPGEFRELKLVNKIRKRVDAWRDKGYPNVTGVTKNLLDFWHDSTKRENRFFFCQLEAIETLIWLVEAHESEKQGLEIPSDGGEFRRLCCKMATGTGKTIVMAMLIAWQVINKATYTQDSRFSKNILVMAPGLTVKSRLQVLLPSNADNIYDQFDIVPDGYRQQLYQGRFTVHNWHTLMPETDAPKSVVKLGPESSTVFSKRILEHDYSNIVVINDEAHHAYRADPEQIKKLSKRDMERDKRWIEGLDRIHRARNILHCFDFSATPFVPSGKNVTEDTLFEWIVSDFSLNDAIESGLTKTPRVVIRDDSSKFTGDYKSRFYHLYRDEEVKPDLNRSAKPHEKLPDVVANAYMLLGQDWLATKKHWVDENDSKIPPVMITVCNRTETAARVMHCFENNKFDIGELSAREHLLHIDSTTISKAEERDSTGVGKEEDLRETVNTVGKPGKLGEQIRNIIAVQMLSEGWDARNVTHIMGLRAFSSQLLCEQVVGRGLRRTSYEISDNGLFAPEYVNVFGVPFTFLPHEGGDGPPPPPPGYTTLIEPDPDKAEHMISWPNIDRINTELLPSLTVNWKKISTLNLQSYGISTTAGMAQILEGKPHVDKMSEIDLHELDKEIRLQRVIFVAAKDVYDSMSPDWKGGREYLLAQIVKLVEEFVYSDKIRVTDVSGDELRTKMTILFNMSKVVSHVCKAIKDSNVTSRYIVPNAKPIKSTSDMRPWHTKKPTEHTVKSHINMAVYDSTWEAGAGQELERNRNVTSWAKNDHLGFVIKYLYNGILHDYYPDFLVRLKNNVMLVLEIKGVDSAQNKEKRKYLAEWTEVINENGGYGTWMWDVAFHPSDVRQIITEHSKTDTSANENAKCPRCGKTSHTRQEVEKMFGFRNVDGLIRPQAWCKKCRV